MMHYMQTLGENGKIMHTWNIKEKGGESVAQCYEVAGLLDTWTLALVKETKLLVCKEL